MSIVIQKTECCYVNEKKEMILIFSGIESIIFLSTGFSLEALSLIFSDSFLRFKCFIPKRGTFDSSKVLKPSDNSGYPLKTD